jgi:hypothetical protein
MDPAQVLVRLASHDRLPIKAIRAAQADRASVVPLFLGAIERYLSGKASRSTRDALFFVFHLLGEWREKSAYRPLAQLLRRPPDELEAILGWATTETSRRIMAAVFDGDPQPLYDVVLDPQADEFIRSQMCEAVAMVALRGELPREEAERFLQACYAKLDPQYECFVWNGWQSAIALLGLVALSPLVEQAFTRGFISKSWMDFEDFEQDVRQGVDDPGALLGRAHEFAPFGDTIEEVSGWFGSSWETRTFGATVAPDWEPPPPWHPSAISQFRNVGRNDPCPCGSGRKFKMCCLIKHSEAERAFR